MLYFDNAATTLVEPSVLDTYVQVSKQFFANPSSVHMAGDRAKALLEQSRKQIADILVVESREVYFTSSGTESNNWFLQGLIEAQGSLRPQAKTILLSPIEHPSITQQVTLLEKRGYQVKWLPVNNKGQIIINQLTPLLDENVLCISTMAVNNEVGVIQDFVGLSNLLAQFPQIIWHVDGVQAVSFQLPVLQEARIDAISLSGHKFHGIKGCGILVVKRRVTIHPLLWGGGQELGLRSSTENLPAIVATARALRLSQENRNQKLESLNTQYEAITNTLKDCGWQVFSGDHCAKHIVCAALSPIPGEVLVHAFGQEGIMISTTSACSSKKNDSHHTLRAMGINDNLAKSAVRISLSSQNTQEEVDVLVATIKEVSDRLSQHLT